MKSRKIVFIAVAVCLATSFILTSCKKKETENNEEPKYRSAQDNSTAEKVFNNAFNQIDKAARASGSKDTITGCPVLYISPGGYIYPKTVTLDFGTGCLCTDGATRTGKIVSVISAPYIDSGSVVTSTFDNYHEIINSIDYQAQGTQVITNLGNNQLGHPTYSVDVQNASVTSTYGTILWNSLRQNEWIAGYDTWLNPWDDVYHVTGSANGTDINGDSFTVNITSALEVQIGCWYIKRGTLDVINPGYPTITVDYGDGSCDATIYVTINGVTYTIIYG